jgi:hypothetical protein
MGTFEGAQESPGRDRGAEHIERALLADLERQGCVVSADDVRREVDRAFEHFSDVRVRNFVAILAERSARVALLKYAAAS